MKPAKRTQGFWRTHKHDASTVIDEQGRVVANCGGYHDGKVDDPRAENLANAAYIVEAPRMEESLAEVALMLQTELKAYALEPWALRLTKTLARARQEILRIDSGS